MTPLEAISLVEALTKAAAGIARAAREAQEASRNLTQAEIDNLLAEADAADANWQATFKKIMNGELGNA